MIRKSMHEFNKVLDYLKENYINRSELPTQEECIKDYLLKARDPYLKYVDSTNPFVSIFDMIGIRVEQVSDAMAKITECLDQREQKLMVGDIIISVNNKNPYNISIAELEQSYERVDIVAIRNMYHDNAFLVREQFAIQNVSTSPKPIVWKDDPEKSICYLRLYDLNQNVKEYIERSFLYEHFIIDLRDNLGGSVRNAYEIINMMCGTGQTAYFKKNCNDDFYEMKVNNPNTYVYKDISILINRHTMSSAELLAISLRDNKNACIIGEKSYGKAVMTARYEIDDKHYIMVPKYLFLSPSGENINHVGIQPEKLCDDKRLDDRIRKRQFEELITIVREE